MGWLIDPQNQQVEIYRRGKPVETLQFPVLLSGEDLLPGFELQFEKITSKKNTHPANGIGNFFSI